MAVIMVFAMGCSTIKVPPNDGNDGEGDNVIIDEGDSKNPTYYFIEDGNLTQYNSTKQDTVNKLQATDDYGRSIDYIDGVKEDKDRYVGLFYFTWLGWHGREMDGVYDVSKLIDEDPNALWNTNGTSNSPLGKYHFWGEPLYGYYNSKDPWVIRKQMELFAMSGIDFLAFDCTNGFSYIDVVTELLPIMQEMYDEGWAVPKFMFYTNSYSANVVKELYSGAKATTSTNPLEKEGIYKKGHYKDLWFMPEGKPKIAAVTEPTSTSWESGTFADNVITDPELLNFFDFWESTWPNNTQWENGLPWIDWNRPQKVLTDTINVPVAQHNLLPFSDALLSEQLADKMYGRGYTTAKGADHSDDAIDSSLNFEENFKYAIEKDVKYTFITGWNEWIAIKSAANLGMNSSYPECRGKRVYFVDTVNREYSRDIELMKDGYGDNVFLSMMRNVRELKGKPGTIAASQTKSIEVKSGLAQWNDVNDIYYNVTGQKNRNFKNFSGREIYEDSSIKNNISSVRVSNDENNLYFLVECDSDINIDVKSKNWMNLMIDVEGQTNDSFYGYDYVINRESSYTGECSVEKYTKTNGVVGYNKTAKANFTVKGKFMQFKVSKASLGITGTAKINFKVADNVNEPENIQSYYITGNVAPVGRINYTYKG